MAKIECTYGPAEPTVAGNTYAFTRDDDGRYTCTVHNEDHVEILLSVVHYRRVDDKPAPEPAKAKEQPAPPQPLTRIVELTNHGPVLIELTPSDEGGYTVTCPDYLDCISEGDTVEAAHQNMAEALQLHLEAIEMHGNGQDGGQDGNEQGAGNGGQDAPTVPVDDLTKIKGIGDALAAKLQQQAGITTFQQLAELTPEQVAILDEKLALHGRVLRDDWIGKARQQLAENTGTQE